MYEGLNGIEKSRVLDLSCAESFYSVKMIKVKIKLLIIRDISVYEMVLKSQSIGPILRSKCDQFLQGENMQILPKLTRNGQIFPNFPPFAPI